MTHLRVITLLAVCVTLARARLLLNVDDDTTFPGAAGMDDGFSFEINPIKDLPFFENKATSIYVSYSYLPNIMLI